MGRADTTDRATRTGLVRSVDRALGLLEHLAAQTRGMTLGDLAAAAELSTSTAHRLLTTLQDRGFVRFERLTGHWLVGRTALAVGANYAGSRELVALARPILRRFSATCGETLNLGVIDDGKVVFLQRVDPRTRQSFVPTVAPAIPAHCSSIGKALLAALPAREIGHALAPEKLVQVTPNTVVSERALRRELEAARRAGFALDDEENTIGLRCVAAPVFDEYGRAVAAVSMAAPADRLNNEHIASAGAMIAAAARELSMRWSGPAADAAHGGRPPGS